MVGPFDVFVEDSEGCSWIGVATSVAEAKSIALERVGTSQAKSIIILSQATMRTTVIALGSGGQTVAEEESAFGI